MEQIQEAIEAGRVDDWLRHLGEVIDKRRSFVMTDYFDGIEQGDAVVFNSQVQPRYLEGQEATVKLTPRRGAKTVQVTLDDAVGRFTAGTTIRAPIAMLDRKEVDL